MIRRGVKSWRDTEFDASDFEDLIDEAPAVDAKPVRHGRWIHDINNLYGCSECLAREVMSSRRSLKNYCPNCGAKMDLEVQDD